MKKAIILWCLLVLPIFNGGLLGIAAILLLLCMILYIWLYRKKGKIYLEKEYVNTVLFLASYLIILSALFFLNMRDLLDDAERLIQYVFCMIIFIYACTTEWTSADFRTMKSCMKIILVIATIMYPFLGVIDKYSAFYQHPNTLGTVCVLGIVFFFLPFSEERGRLKLFHRTPIYTWTDLFFIIDAVFLIIVSGSRASMLMAFVFIMNLIMARYIKNPKMLYRTELIALSLFIAWFTVVYPRLYGTDLGYTLNELSKKYLNKNFFSGRQIVWSEILDAMNDHILFGYGLSMVPEYLYKTNFSSHNLFLQVYLQGGLVGLGGIIIIIAALFSRFVKMVDWSSKPYFIGFLAAICIHECFEVTLVQNQMGIALLNWFTLGIMMSKTDITV